MPPFRLERLESRPPYNRTRKLLYTKNVYSDGVRVRQWEDALEQEPLDFDPYCQGKVNHFLSHYRSLGTGGEAAFTTTTQAMLEQSQIKSKLAPDKLMNNYYTYNDNAECLREYAQQFCPEVCAGEFKTTMQHSYQVPRPYIMRKLGIPAIPFMLNRKWKHEVPDLSPEKFYGENFEQVTGEMRTHKSCRWVSFNPMTGDYTKT